MFEPSSKHGIGNGGVRAKLRHLESEMEEFEPSSRIGIGNGVVQDKFRHLESGMVEFEPSSKLESEMEEFDSNSDAWNLEWKSSRQVR